MSTRAMYTFKNKKQTVHVYKHHDGYPEGALSWIANARNYAWQLPRFEPDDFAAAFVAANKPKFNPDDKYPNAGGGVRLCDTSIKEPWEFSSDSEFWYVVTFEPKKQADTDIFPGGALHLKIYEVSWWKTIKNKLMFSGTLEAAIAKYNAQFLEPLESSAS